MIRTGRIPTFPGPEVPTLGEANCDAITQRTFPSHSFRHLGTALLRSNTPVPRFHRLGCGKGSEKSESAKQSDVSPLHLDLLQSGHDVWGVLV